METISKRKIFQIEEKTAVTLGKFDGLHKGHQKLLNKVSEKAQEGLSPLVFTFDVSPNSVFSQKEVDTLLTNQERRYKFSALGIKTLIEYPFTQEVADMEAEDFIREILVKQCNVAYIAVGEDYHFGKGAKGDFKLLQTFSKQYSYEVEVIPKEQYHGREISSTFVREELQKGNMKTVFALLGYHYFAKGQVVQGNQFGRTMGMPTANLIACEGKILPPNGVYVSSILFREKQYQGITNIGYKPTVSENKVLGIETYLYDFNENLYGETIQVEFLEYLRPEYKFASTAELKAQIVEDVKKGAKYLIDNRS